jgi:hypothetical protein
LAQVLRPGREPGALPLRGVPRLPRGRLRGGDGAEAAQGQPGRGPHRLDARAAAASASSVSRAHRPASQTSFCAIADNVQKQPCKMFKPKRSHADYL